MSFDQAFERALEHVADGLPVDWAALERLASVARERDLVLELRLLAGVGQTHGTAAGEARPPSDPSAETTSELATVSPSTPQMWGRFQLVRPLGQGSYGVVYLGRDGVLDRDVAIKLFHGTIGDRVKEEGRLLAQIKHEHVVKIHDVAEHAGRFGLCMEYIDGRTLADIVRVDGPMSAEQAAIDGQAIAKALAAVHAKGVLHRDVTARNVMRERGGRLVLMDLGAGIMPDQTPGGGPPKNVGTPLFMAPELLDETASASQHSDVYSLGVLLYYLVTGRYPVEGSTVEQIRQNHRGGRRVPLDVRRLGLPTAYVQLVERATSPIPADRYESAVALLRDLNRIVTPDPPPLPAPPPAPPAPQPWTPSIRVIAGAAVAILGLGLCSGLLATWTFNSMLDRSDPFEADSLLTILGVGLQSMVQPAFVMGALLGVLGLGGAVGRLLGLQGRFRDAVLHVIKDRVAEREYATVLAQLTTLAGVVAIVIVVSGFGDVVVSFVSRLSTSPLEAFQWLHPQGPARVQRVLYRSTVAALVLMVVLGWRNVRLVRLKYGGTVPGWLRAAAVIQIGVLFVMLQAPYKLVADDQNQLPVVLHNGVRCYLLGIAGGEVRTFCPTAPLPRVRTTPLDERALQRCGFDENVFAITTVSGCTSSHQ